MLKPRLVKSLITQNATLLREKQQLIDYFRAVEMMLRLIGKNGKDSGVVELKDVFALADDMRGILLSYDLHNSKKMGTMHTPTKQELGKMAEADKNIMHGFFSGSADDMNEFLSKMIYDLMKHKPPSSDKQSSADGDFFYKFFQFPTNPEKFGADLNGYWQDPPPSDEDPFGNLGLDKPD